MTSPFEILLNPAETKSVHVSEVRLVDSSGRYRIGKATRPHIEHDNGHLDAFARRAPTDEETMQYRKWLALLEGGEVACGPLLGNVNPLCSYETWPDALAAYRHFMIGGGKPRNIDYERYILNDPAAKSLIHDLVGDFQYHAEVIGRDRLSFSVTSTTYAIGGRDRFAPYPQTVNWQRTLGGHVLWISAEVRATVNDAAEIVFDADMTIHMEDRYNFNVGQADVSTGIPGHLE